MHRKHKKYAVTYVIFLRFFLCFTHSLTDARVFWYVSLFDLIFCFVVALNVYHKIRLHLYLDKVVQSRQIYVKKSQVSLLFWLKFEFLFGAYFFFSIWVKHVSDFYGAATTFEACECEIVFCSTTLLIMNVCLFDVVDWQFSTCDLEWEKVKRNSISII